MTGPTPPTALFAPALTALLIVLIVGGCSARQATAERHPAPSLAALDRAGAEAVVLKADAARRAAFADLGAGGLMGSFRGKALRVLKAQVQRMRDRGLRLEERNPVLAVVFWDARAAEVVLQVEAEHRLVTVDQADPPWAATVRQWWSRLASADGGWWVVDQNDLAPDQWRSP
jgi:hypothetical protein